MMTFRSPYCFNAVQVSTGHRQRQHSSLLRAIQKAVSFDNDHLYDFYAGRHYRNRKVRYADDEDWEVRESAFSKLQLSGVYPLNGLKLYYWFDFGDNWIFEIRKARKVKPIESGLSYPRVIESHGPNPEQYPSWD